MKANRKFLNGEDEAVSPVIAVILMVAITVVLAATVYVWVSGFGSQSSQPAKTMSLTSAASLDTTNSVKDYTVASATAGMRWSDISVTVNGAARTLSADACATDTGLATEFRVCRASATLASTDTINAGDEFTVGGATAGATLRILDSQANSVILTLSLG